MIRDCFGFFSLPALLILALFPATTAVSAAPGASSLSPQAGAPTLQLTLQGAVVHEVELFTMNVPAEVPVHGLGFQLAMAAPEGGEESSGKKKGKKPYVAPNWLAGEPNSATWITTGILGAGWSALAIDSDTETIESVGDVTQILPAVAGMGVALGTKDWQGTKQYVFSLLTSTAIVHWNKNVNEKYRPDATNAQSFPSGHTQASFAGAGFIQRRYGPKWGIPAMTMAAYTAYSRVRAQKHFTDDVISGMSIALIGNWIFVEPVDPERAARAADMERDRKYRYAFEVADGNVTKNVVQAPRDTGTPINWEFDEVADPQITASIAFDYEFKPRHFIKTRYTPFEIRDVGTLTEDTLFKDRVFDAGQEVFSIYFLGDLRSRYAYELLPDSRFSVQAGGGLTWIDTTVDLFEADYTSGDLVVDESTRTTVRARGFMPLAYLKLGVKFSELVGVYAEADGMYLSQDRFLDGTVKLKFYVDARWDVGIGWRWVDDDLELSELANEFARNGLLVDVGFSF